MLAAGSLRGRRMTSMPIHRSVQNHCNHLFNQYSLQSSGLHIQFPLSFSRCTIVSPAVATSCSTFRQVASFSFPRFRGMLPIDITTRYHRALIIRGEFRRMSSQSPLSELKRTSTKNARWDRIAYAVRVIRIPVLVLSVYSFGYQQGVIDCTKAPGAIQDQIMSSILLSSGVKNFATEVQIIKESELSIFRAYAEPQYKIAAVGHRIVQSARQLVNEELHQAIADVTATLPTDITPVSASRHLNENNRVEFWYNARLRLEGEHVSLKPWSYVIISNPVPNAFVTEVLPQHLFITTAMLDLANTPDQLAFVLGHEISHLVMGHVSNGNKFETFLRTLEILCLSLDPTAGLISIAFITGLYAIRTALSASFSRENEYQADEVGLVLAARACFDTVSGVEVMRKMYEHGIGIAGNSPQSTKSRKRIEGDASTENSEGDVLVTSSQLSLGLLDTHPPTLERFERLQQMANDGENYTKYQNKQCANVTSRFFNALLWK